MQRLKTKTQEHNQSEQAVKLRTHLEEIARNLGCKIEWGFEGMMYAEECPPRIETPFLEKQEMGIGKSSVSLHIPSVEAAYLIGLHELGHIWYGHTQGRPPHENQIHYFENGVLKSEAEAWEFALDNSLIEPSEEDRDMMLQCIMSYVKGADIKLNQLSRLYNGNRHHHEFYYDQRTVFVDNIIKRIKGN